MSDSSIKNNGWIKLHRELLDNDMWNNLNSDQRNVMITCLLLANHKPNQWQWEGKIFTLERGQFITSSLSLAQKCHLTRQKIRTSLVKLERWGFLTNKSTKTGTLITIVNYGKYQDRENKLTNKLTNNQPTANQQLTTNKNDKNDKNDKNKTNSITNDKTISNTVNQHSFKKTSKDLNDNDQNNGVVNKGKEVKGNELLSTHKQLTDLSVSARGVRKDKNKYAEKFDEIYKKYPRKRGLKAARKHFNASVKTEKDWADINKALANYLKSKNVVEGNTQYIQHASTWFNNWQEWVEYTEPSENENAGWA